MKTTKNFSTLFLGYKGIFFQAIFGIVFISIFILFTGCNKKLEDRGLKVGWAMEDITPKGPVSLKGQYYERISKYVQSPLKATAVAIEQTDSMGNVVQTIMVSMDVVTYKGSFQDSLRLQVKDLIPDFDVNNLILNVTHTHSSFDTGIGSVYREMLLHKLSKVVVDAWKNRQPAAVSRALRYVVVGHNRRVNYADGTTQMYGSTDRKDFIGLEGPEDSGVDMLFCWDLKKNLTGIIMNVSCPAQVTEAKYYVSADYWGEVRKEIAKRISKDVFVLPQIGAAGDIAPRDLPSGYKSGEPNMWDISGIIEIGKRLGQAIEDAYPEAKNSAQSKVVFKHAIKKIQLPKRKYSKDEYEEAHAVLKEIHSRVSTETAWNNFLKEIKENEQKKEYGPWDNKLSDYGTLKKKEALIKMYEQQEKGDTIYPVEIHAIRLGNVVFITNPFELFVDYGFRITGRDKAKQTFIVQLCSGDYGGYLPTKRAAEGDGYRGYSAMVDNIGPVGGQILVNESVDLINSLWQ